MKNILQLSTVDNLFFTLLNEADKYGIVSAVTSLATVKELIMLGFESELEIGIIDIDNYEYDDAYIFTLCFMDNITEMSVEKAKSDTIGYLCGADNMFVDYTLKNHDEYTIAVNNNPFCEAKIKYFVIGKDIPENERGDDKKYNCHNKFDDGKCFNGVPFDIEEFTIEIDTSKLRRLFEYLNLC